MKGSFKSFEIPEPQLLEAAWRSEKTLFVFDTNVLLNLYGYEESTRQDFFKILEKLRPNIWIPHQVGLEYHRRRLDVIKNEKKVFREIKSELEKIPSDIEAKFNSTSLSKKFPELSTHLKSLIESIRKDVKKCNTKIQEWDSRQPDVRSKDEILDKIDAITHDKIGSPPLDQEWLNTLYAEGAERYKKKLPPGFCDKDKGKGSPDDASFIYNNLNYERQYGDLILWKQLIEHAIQANIESVILITDDTKKDWWRTVDSAGLKIIGPNEDLKSEIYRETEVSLFHMYTSSAFLVASNNILKANIPDRSIEDIQDKNRIVLDLEKFKPDDSSEKLEPDLSNTLTPKELLEKYGRPDRIFGGSNPNTDTLSKDMLSSARDHWKTITQTRHQLEELRSLSMQDRLNEIQALDSLQQLRRMDDQLNLRSLREIKNQTELGDIENFRERNLNYTPDEISRLIHLEELRKFNHFLRAQKKDENPE
ncbi:PIN-like domain-containing protein [Pseudomonas sp. DWRC2-2]|uniref:PIN-like domain-containing protein n=1 Tax=Pseudomonas sp. DWRC2-2 TaxID=2804567 RepID=UPI003CE6AB11